VGFSATKVLAALQLILRAMPPWIVKIKLLDNVYDHHIINNKDISAANE
jgi:hypothetical protein